MEKIRLVALVLFVMGYKSLSAASDCKPGKIITICRNLTLQENHPIEIENYTQALKLYPPLKELPPKVFTQLQDLKILIVNFTLMEKIYSSSFSGLKNLQELDLYWNQIPNIPVDAFHDCPNLIYLNLGGNDLENINGDVFAHLKHLKKLIISSNLLNSVPELSNLKKLELLDLSKNKIKKLEDGVLNGLESLITLNLKGNEMVYISRDAFHGLIKLRYLNLERNNLDKIDEVNIWGNLTNLREIRLNMNDFSCEDLRIIIPKFMNKGVVVPEGLAEPELFSYHGFFCLPESVRDWKRKNF